VRFCRVLTSVLTVPKRVWFDSPEACYCTTADHAHPPHLSLAPGVLKIYSLMPANRGRSGQGTDSPTATQMRPGAYVTRSNTIRSVTAPNRMGKVSKFIRERCREHLIDWIKENITRDLPTPPPPILTPVVSDENSRLFEFKTSKMPNFVSYRSVEGRIARQIQSYACLIKKNRSPA
jgi:hypothetical protein